MERIMKYSVIMYNFNDYEIMRPLPNNIDNDTIDYLYVTDNSKMSGNGWRIIVDNDLNGLSPFDKCYSVRFNLFKYTDSDICLYLDGSMQIHKSLAPLFDWFNKSNADLGLMVHPDRTTMWDEYCTWFSIRNYPKSQGFKCLHYMQSRGYDIHSYKGLYQGGMRFVRNTERNKSLDRDVFNTLKQLGDTNTIERLDQTIHSFYVNSKYSDISIFPFSQHLIQSDYIGICPHHSAIVAAKRTYISSTGYVRNKLVKLDTGI